MPPWAFAAALAAISSLVLAIVVNRFGRWLGLLHPQGPGGAGASPVVRLGGTAILPAFLVGWILSGGTEGPWVGVVVGAAGATAVGLVDDLRGTSPPAKLTGQFGVAIAATALGIRIANVSNPFGGTIELHDLVGAALTVMWLVGMMNAVNLLDGLDGLAPGVALVSAAILAILSAQLGSIGLALFGAALAGSIAGFLPLNAYRARLILGDSGSHLLGFLIGSLAVLGQAKIGTTLLVLGIPILDVVWTMLRRRQAGRSIASRDNEHLHHRLLKAGLTQPQVTLAYVLLCGAFGVVALLLDRFEKLFALAALTLVTVLLLCFSARRAPPGRRPD